MPPEAQRDQLVDPPLERRVDRKRMLSHGKALGLHLDDVGEDRVVVSKVSRGRPQRDVRDLRDSLGGRVDLATAQTGAHAVHDGPPIR